MFLVNPKMDSPGCVVAEDVFGTPVLYQPGFLMSHNWLHTPDCKIMNEETNLDSPSCFILESSIVQPQLQVMRPLSDSNVEFLGAAQYVLILAFA